jgi:DNA recombination protein RmuC
MRGAGLMDMGLIAVTGILGVLVVAVSILVVVLLRRPRGGLSASFQDLAQAVQHEQAQIAVLTEKLTQIEPVTQAVGSVQVELRGLSERIATVEQSQSQVNHSVFALGTGLAETGTLTKSLAATTSAIQSELLHAKEGLTKLQTYAKARQELEQQTSESIRRLEAIISGTHTKGAAGEHILEVVFAKLPPDWQVRDFRVGNKVVEFGLRLPNNLVLPIDSKWTATHLLEQFIACDDPAEQQGLRDRIGAAVLDRAKEVRKYVDPNVTVNFGVVAVPDAVYDLCCGIQADVFQLGVVLIGYSMFIPYLLLVFQTILKTSQSVDLQKLDAYLQSVQDSINALQDELQGRFSRAITMLRNSRSDMSAHLSRIGSGLTALQISAGGVRLTPLIGEGQSIEVEVGA